MIVKCGVVPFSPESSTSRVVSGLVIHWDNRLVNLRLNHQLVHPSKWQEEINVTLQGKRLKRNNRNNLRRRQPEIRKETKASLWTKGSFGMLRWWGSSSKRHWKRNNNRNNKNDTSSLATHQKGRGLQSDDQDIFEIIYNPVILSLSAAKYLNWIYIITSRFKNSIFTQQRIEFFSLHKTWFDYSMSPSVIFFCRISIKGLIAFIPISTVLHLC